MTQLRSYIFVFFAVGTFVSLSKTAFGQAATTSPSLNADLNVYDSKGAYVGKLLEKNIAAQSINGSWISFPVGHLGLKAEGLSLYYTTQNCTGPAYLAANDLPIRGVIYTEPGVGAFEVSGFYAGAGTLVYPTPPYSLMTMGSVLGVQSLTSATGIVGSCATLESKASILVGTAGTIKIGPYKLPLSTR